MIFVRFLRDEFDAILRTPMFEIPKSLESAFQTW